MFKLPTLKYKIDGSSFLAENNLNSAEFNPCYPLIAVMMYEHLYVITYGGEARKKRGQILFGIHFVHPSLMYRAVNWSPSGDYLLMLEEDKEMFPSLTLTTNRIKIFHYDATNFSFNEITFRTPLIPSPAMNTRFLWLDCSSFIFADERKNIFKTITLHKDKKAYDESQVDLSGTLEPFRKNEQRTKYISYVNSIFVLPDAQTPYLFFLACCPTQHQHQRLLYVDKKTHQVVKVASLPGEVVSIAVNLNRFFLLLQTRPYEDYKYNEVIVADNGFEKCLFSDPFLGKISDTNFDNYSREAFIFEGNSTAVWSFRPLCCGIVSSTESLLKKDTNSRPENLFLYFGKLAKASDLYLTQDYLYYVNKITQTTRVFGANSHFGYDVALKDDYVFPVSKYIAFFHPNKPFFIRKKRGNYFDIYLLPWATDDDRRDFPEIDDEAKTADYNQSISFLPIS